MKQKHGLKGFQKTIVKYFDACTDLVGDEQAKMKRMFLVFGYIGPDIRQSLYQVDLKINYVLCENRSLS